MREVRGLWPAPAGLAELREPHGRRGRGLAEQRGQPRAVKGPIVALPLKAATIETLPWPWVDTVAE